MWLDVILALKKICHFEYNLSNSECFGAMVKIHIWAFSRDPLICSEREMFEYINQCKHPFYSKTFSSVSAPSTFGGSKIGGGLWRHMHTEEETLCRDAVIGVLTAPWAILHAFIHIPAAHKNSARRCSLHRPRHILSFYPITSQSESSNQALTFHSYSVSK